MDECLKLADWNGFAKRAAESKKHGKLRGRGIGYFLEEAADLQRPHGDPLRSERHASRSSPAPIRTARAIRPSMRRWCTNGSACRSKSIRFIQGDTNEVPIGRGTYGSRSMHVGGNALKRAADAIIEKAKPMAAMMMEAAAGDIEFKDGSFHIVGTDRALPLTAVAQSLHRPMFLPPQFEVGLEASGTFAAEPSNYPNGCHVCEVEIDPETGVVTLVRYAAVDDVGKVINSLLCEGQIHGGVAQGRRPGADGSRSCSTPTASSSPAASRITPCRAPRIFPIWCRS